MATFRHPFLTRGTVRLANRAFIVSRGLVEMPDEIGESQGWSKVECDEVIVQPSTDSSRRAVGADCRDRL